MGGGVTDLLFGLALAYGMGTFVWLVFSVLTYVDARADGAAPEDVGAAARLILRAPLWPLAALAWARQVMDDARL